MKIDNKNYLTSFEVAERIGVTPDYIRRLCVEGKIKAIKLGHNWIIKPSQLKQIKRVRFPRQKD